MIGTENRDTGRHRRAHSSTDDLRSANRLRRRLESIALATLATILILVSTAVAAASVVGRYTVVSEGLESTKPGQTRAYGTRVGANVVIGEQIDSGSTSAVQLLFGENAVINLAPNTRLRIGDGTEKDGGEPIPLLELTGGLLRIFASRMSNRESDIRISTPAGVVVVSAAEAAVEILADGRVRVAHLGGRGSVHWQAVGSEARDLDPGNQWLIAADGKNLEVEPLEASTESELRLRTEPLPSLPQERPHARWHEDYGPDHLQGRWQALGETATLHSGLCGLVVYNPGAAGFAPNPVSTEVQVFDNSGTLRATQKSDARGGYEIPLHPGHYRVVLPDYGVVFKDVKVPAGACTDPKLRINAP